MLKGSVHQSYMRSTEPSPAQEKGLLLCAFNFFDLCGHYGSKVDGSGHRGIEKNATLKWSGSFF